MQNYNIEGNVDFYNELYKSLDIDENIHKTEEDDNLCLITNSILTTNYVEMFCGHKFNYVPLYHDIKNHKYKFNNMESSNGRLNIDEIRCPYCRKKQKSVLPYYEELGLEKITGVNTLEQIAIKSTKCEYLTPNPKYEPNVSITSETHEYNYGNCKFLKCLKYGNKIGNSDVIFDASVTEQLKGKYYCNKHKKCIIKEANKEFSEKAKNELKLLKIKQKEDLKKAKEDSKKTKEEEKAKAKEELKKIVTNAKSNITPIITDGENAIVGIIETVNNLDKYCAFILKTGANKGNVCGCKVIENNLCKRHLASSNKKG